MIVGDMVTKIEGAKSFLDIGLDYCIVFYYSKEEYSNEYGTKRLKQHDQQFEAGDPSVSNTNDIGNNKKCQFRIHYLCLDNDKSFADRHNPPTNVICVLGLAFEATEAMVSILVLS